EALRLRRPAGTVAAADRGLRQPVRREQQPRQPDRRGPRLGGVQGAVL
ncbi:MAG: hypothetical protein AVDCRST_MAG16-533, partial [uncultured Frankineae bacterium]